MYKTGRISTDLEAYLNNDKSTSLECLLASRKCTPPSYFYPQTPIPNTHSDLVDLDQSLLDSHEALEKMINVGILARQALDLALSLAVSGRSTDDIDRAVFEYVTSPPISAYPSTLRYHGFPKSICTSVNEVVAHGIPDDRVLCKGDLINIDITLYKDGFHGDTSETIIVHDDPPQFNGESGESRQRRQINVDNDDALQSKYALMDIAREAMWKGIEQCGPGKLFTSIGAAIEDYVHAQGYHIVEELVGHGIGKEFHLDPYIIPVRNEYIEGAKMQPGHCFTIEPIVIEHSVDPQSNNAIQKWDDQWTLVPPNKALSAQFEHTIV
eukprot:CAMPEP_0201555398 /NCGR_PEP_ID=MMETSP0173_2-20130828/48562_1 /ASSEMBLY_ACC=CAM_ASM_000268 /TAXON_ID=218659 /ORGANISM="Vexillifera sp., Strain DIVA3 564/2" /LENGTH=324 /DNA_ID=CAMNT_0047967173 /DNA_START=298 /DNA_END=1269 /DNA_ORIENTATION=+